MQVIPVDNTRLGSVTFVRSEPDAVFGTGEQKERNGLLVWAVETLIRPEEGRSSVEVVKVVSSIVSRVRTVDSAEFRQSDCAALGEQWPDRNQPQRRWSECRR